MLTGPQFIIMHVNSVDEAVPFYTDKLGMEVEDQNPYFAQFKTEGNSAALALSAEFAPNLDSTNEVWWFVSDVDSLHDELVGKGVEIAEPLTNTNFGRTFTIKDPSGNKLYMLQLPVQ